jgi:hypothetical protein
LIGKTQRDHVRNKIPFDLRDADSGSQPGVYGKDDRFPSDTLRGATQNRGERFIQ